MTMLKLALGSFKDQAAIGKAIISGHCLLADLEIAVIHATAHNDVPAEEKYVNEILFLVSNNPGSTPFLAERISRRLEKTHDPIVALKTLLLVHRLMRGGDRSFEQDLHSSSWSGHLRISNLHNGTSFHHSSYGHHHYSVSFIHSYASFLEERMDWVINQGGKLVSIIQRSSNKGNSMEMVFSNLPIYQTFLDRAMDCLPSIDLSFSDKIIQSALAIILRESVQVYNSTCEALATLIDSIPELNMKARGEAMNFFKRASRQSYKLFDFFEKSKKLMVIESRNMNYPSVQIIDAACVKNLEDCLGCSTSDFGDGVSSSPSADKLLPITQAIDLSETTVVRAASDDDMTEMIKADHSGFSPSNLETRISTVWVEFNDQDDLTESTYSSNEGLDEPFGLDFDGWLTTDIQEMYQSAKKNYYNPFVSSSRTNYDNLLGGR